MIDDYPNFEVGDHVELKYKSLHNQFKYIQRTGKVVHIKKGIHFTVKFRSLGYSETYLFSYTTSKKKNRKLIIECCEEKSK